MLLGEEPQETTRLIRATGMHAIITGCSCVICMDLTVCHKQIEEKWRQQIIVVAEHEFSNIEGIY